MTTSPSLGVLIGLPAAGLLVLVALGIIGFGICLRFADGEWSDALFPIGIGVVGIIVVVALTGWFMWPWTAEYHEWQTVSGTITNINSRLLASGTEGGGSTQRFVVQFAAGGAEYSCDDTRCSLLHDGDKLTLSCKRAWQYTGTPGYDCNFVDATPAGGGK